MNSYLCIQKIINMLPEYQGSHAIHSGLSVSQILLRLHLENDLASIRRIQRYMLKIEHTYPGNLVITSVNRAHHYSWQGKKPHIAATHDSHIALGLLMLQHQQTPLPKALRLALDEQQYQHQLAAPARHNDQQDYRHWLHKVRRLPDSSPLLPAPVHPDIELAVESAILKNRTLSILCPKHPDWLKVHTVGLVHKGPRIYLTAVENHSGKIMHFCMHQLQHAQLEQEPCRPSPVSIDTLIQRGEYDELPHVAHDDQVLPLDLQVSTEYFKMMTEMPLSLDQTVEAMPDGGYRIRASMKDSANLREWLLSHARDINVISPASIRDSIRDNLQQALLAYAA